MRRKKSLATAALAVLTLFLTAAQKSGSTPAEFSDKSRTLQSASAPDYFKPETAAPGRGTYTTRGAALMLAPALAAFSPFSPTPVDYTAFDGRAYRLNLFRGVHVEVLLPDSWLDPSRATPPEVYRLVDSADTTYDLLAKLTRAEPAGDGPATIAFVPLGQRGHGLARQGAKGAEISDDDQTLREITGELKSSRFSKIVRHELEHNFDIYSDRLQRAPADGHAWTTALDAATSYWSGDDGPGLPPAEQLRAATLGFRSYLSEPGASWPDRIPATATANQVWAGTLLAAVELHGPGLLQRYLAALKDSTAPSHPTDPAARDDLQIEMLSAAAGENLSCYADAWRWPLSQQARERLAATYGAGPARACRDADSDKWTPLAGDTDDSDPETNPGAAERKDGRDHNSNGIPDDVEAREADAAGGDFADAQTQPVTLPYGSRATGVISSASDQDYFRVRLPDAPNAPGSPYLYAQVALRSKTPGFSVEFEATQPDGSQTGVRGRALSTDAGTLVRIYVRLLPRQLWTFRVFRSTSRPEDKTSGSYEIVVADGHDPRGRTWPDDRPGLSWQAAAQGGSPRLTASWSEKTWSELSAAGATGVRLWLAGSGWVAEVPAAREVAFDLPAAPPPDPAAFRVEPVRRLSAGSEPLPLAQLSQPFFYNPAANSAAAQAPTAPEAEAIRPPPPLPPDVRPAPSRRQVRECVSPSSIISINTTGAAAPGWTLTVNGSPAPVYTVAPAGEDQNTLEPRARLETYVPADAPSSGTLTVAVNSPDGRVTSTQVCLAPIAPALWTYDDGSPLAVLSATMEEFPRSGMRLTAVSGRTLILFGTGFGGAPDRDPSNNTNGLKNVSEFYGAYLTLTDAQGRTAFIPASLDYAGPTPQGPPGLEQLNVTLPAEAAGAGRVELHLLSPAGTTLPAVDLKTNLLLTP